MRRVWAFVIICLVGLCFVAVSPAGAQEQPAEQGGAGSETLLTYIQYGGFVGYLIILLSVAGVGLAIEAFLSLRPETFCPADLRRQVEMLFDEGEYEEVMNLCEASPCFMTRILAAGLPVVAHGYEKVEAAMQEALDGEAQKAFQKISYLSLVASQATMWGLLGTVTGMIASFSVIAHSAQTPHPSQLASGVQQALVTTAQGLFVAIPVGGVFFWMRNRVTTALNDGADVCKELMSRFKEEE